MSNKLQDDFFDIFTALYQLSYSGIYKTQKNKLLESNQLHIV